MHFSQVFSVGQDECPLEQDLYLSKHVDEDIPYSGLQNFQWRGTTIGAPTAFHPTQEEQTSALLYMYSNMDEMEQYFVLVHDFCLLIVSWWFIAHLFTYSFTLTICLI
jgi:hypothetical protein